MSDYTINITPSSRSSTVITITEVGPIGPTGPRGPLAPIRLAPFIGGTLNAGETLLRYISEDNFTFDPSKCQASAEVAACDETIFSLRRKRTGVETEIATCTFAPGSAVGVINFTETDVQVDDVLLFLAPISAEICLADISFVFYGTINS